MAMTVQERREANRLAKQRQRERDRANAEGREIPDWAKRQRKAPKEEEKRIPEPKPPKPPKPPKVPEPPKEPPRPAKPDRPKQPKEPPKEPARPVKPPKKPRTAEQKAKHAAAQRAYKKRLKSLTQNEKNLLSAARKLKIKKIKPSNVKDFANYLEKRKAMEKDKKFGSQKLDIVMDQYNDLLESKTVSNADDIMADFAQFLDEEQGIELSNAYSYQQAGDAWDMYMSKLQEEGVFD